MSDKIRTRLLNLDPTYYKTKNAVRRSTKENIAIKLKEFRKWLKKRFPIIVGVVSFAAGLFSIIFTVIKLTSGGVKKLAEATHSVGKKSENISQIWSDDGKYWKFDHFPVEFHSTRYDVGCK